ncbi:MAG: hypothetical protein M5R41_06395 [Bacteroidia bacterium]|nr:hypothetical protein [Bacteroidia bacterium]
MSEYQYHGFLAADTPLNAENMASLRRISSSARITLFSFANSYSCGNVPAGDPAAGTA